MSFISDLKAAFANLSPNVDLDKNEQDIAYLKAAIDGLGGDDAEITTLPGTSIPLGVGVSTAFAYPCAFVADNDPIIDLVDGIDTVVPMLVDSDLPNGAGTDAIVNDDDQIEVVVGGVYGISVLSQADISGADESGTTLVDYKIYLGFNEDATGPFYNFGKLQYETGGSFVNPIVSAHHLTCYLEAGDVLIPTVCLNGSPLEDDGALDTVYVVLQRTG